MCEEYDTRQNADEENSPVGRLVLKHRSHKQNLNDHHRTVISPAM